MRILSIIKQVPDSSAIIKISNDGKAIDCSSIKLVMNPFDEFAVEQAVQLREKGLPVEDISVLTIGTDKAVEILRTALAMGADQGIHLNDPLFFSHDEIYLAQITALAIKALPSQFDLIITGKQAIDMDAGEFGPALAALLDWPHVGAAVGLEVRGTSAKVRRRVEGAEEMMESSLPLLVTCEKGLVEPRYPSLPNLMKAKKKPLSMVNAASLAGFDRIDKPRTEMVSLALPTARTTCKLVEGEPVQMAKELVRLLREEAKVI